MTATRLITLANTRVLDVALILAVLATVCAVAVLYPYGFYNLKCARFDMPECEAAFGFRLGEMEAPSSNGRSYKVQGIAIVEPNGVFARSGIRARRRSADASWDRRLLR
jgi:hypothetical protein